jgi:hypothetical protein
MDWTLGFESIETLETVREDRSIGLVGATESPEGS